jgi:hypothetical protein
MVPAVASFVLPLGSSQFEPYHLHHPVCRYRTPPDTRAFVPRNAGFSSSPSSPYRSQPDEKAVFARLSLHPKIPFPAAGAAYSGEVLGPKILFAGNIFPKGGHPVYLPAEIQLPEAATSDEAAQMARGYLAMGLAGIKLFTGSSTGDKPTVNMDTAVAKAAVDVAHAQGKPVFAHPQKSVGVDVVIAAGVDVLAHTVPREAGYTQEELAAFKLQGTALIPTLSLFAKAPVGPTLAARLVESGVNQLKAFSGNGGVILFGTDVGFTEIYDTSLEYELMHRALSEREVLASLTTNPARYFKAAKQGRVEKGFDADFVVLEGDPIADVHNLANVAYTIRAGQIIYQKP